MRSDAFRSMRVQTAAIIVVGLVLSHAAAYLLYAQDRRDALMMTEALDVAERTAGISRLIRNLPAGWRSDIVEASDSRAFRVWSSRGPGFENNEPSEEEIELADYLRSQVPRVADNEMRVMIVPAGAAPLSAPARPRAAISAPLIGAPELPSPNRYVAITMSHGDGEWLNFLGQTNTPTTFLPEFLGLSIILAVFGIGLVAFWLVHRVIVPLTRFSLAAERFGRTMRVEPLSETGPREIATAAATFNRMQRRLVELIEGRTELLAAISHDLRTPITQMRLRTELRVPSADREKTLAALDDMEGIIATFLEYARATHEPEERTRSDIGALVESICADLADTGANVSCKVEDGMVTNCKRLALKRAVSNLIENALKHAGSARVEAHACPIGILVQVDDNGPGIADEEIEAVFTPFRRGEASRNRETGGVGLGLSISQAIAEDHRGGIRLRNRLGGGLRAELFLPYHPSDHGVTDGERQ